MKRICGLILILFSLNGWGQSQPENVQTRVGLPATTDYVTNQMAWQRLYFEAEIRSMREAVDKVDKTTTAKFEAQNEWRAQSKDREGMFVTRNEIWTAFVFIVGMMFMILNYIKKSNDNKIVK